MEEPTLQENGQILFFFVHAWGPFLLYRLHQRLPKVARRLLSDVACLAHWPGGGARGEAGGGEEKFMGQILRPGQESPRGSCHIK